MNRTRIAGKRRTGVVAAVGTAVMMALGVFVSAPAAEAHAQLVSTVPSADAVLKSSPANISITMNELVKVSAGGLQLLSAEGKVLRRSAAATSSTLSLPGGKLAKGRYVLRWSVESEDGHRIIDAMAFSVNTPTAKSRSASVTLKDAAKGDSTRLQLDGSAVGLRNVTIPGQALDGVVEWKSALFGAPLTWKLSPAGATLTGKGSFPAPGVYTVTVRIRVDAFEEKTLTGKVTIIR